MEDNFSEPQFIPLVIQPSSLNTVGGEYYQRIGPQYYNAVIDTINGIPYVTQRPPIRRIYNNPNVSSTNGRGVYNVTIGGLSNNLSVVGGNVYKNNSSTFLFAFTSPGANTANRNCYFAANEQYVAINDSFGNSIYLVELPALTAVTSPEGQPGLFNRNHGNGIVQLDGYLFLPIDGTRIQNSNLDNPNIWQAINFVSTERETAVIKMIAKHKDNIAVFTNKYIEFFYNAANPVGSPLKRRNDVFHNIGIEADTVTELGDEIYFLGSEATNNVAVYRLANFQVTRISNPHLETYLLGQKLLRNPIQAVHVNGKRLLFISTRTYVLMFDIDTGAVSRFFSTALNGPRPVAVARNFPQAEAELNSVLQDSQGNLYSFGFTEGLNFVAYDTSIAVDAGATKLPIELEVTTAPYTGGTHKRKYLNRIDLHMLRTSTDQTDTTVGIRWYDNDYFESSPIRYFNAHNKNRFLTRCGSFRSRAFNVGYAGYNKVYLNNLELNIGLGES